MNPSDREQEKRVRLRAEIAIERSTPLIPGGQYALTPEEKKKIHTWARSKAHLYPVL